MGVYYTDKGTFSYLGAAAKAGATKSVSKEQSRKITENYYSSQSKTSSSGGGSGTSIILGGVSTPYGPQSVPSPQTPLITQSTPTNQAEVQAQLATFKAQSRPGFTTISQGGRLVNVPESPQYQYDPVSTPADAQIGRSGVSIGTPFNELSPERQQEIKDSLRDESGFVDEIALQRSRYVERDGVPSIESRQSFQSFPLNEAARREQARLSQPTSIVPDLPDIDPKPSALSWAVTPQQLIQSSTPFQQRLVTVGTFAEEKIFSPALDFLSKGFSVGVPKGYKEPSGVTATRRVFLDVGTFVIPGISQVRQASYGVSVGSRVLGGQLVSPLEIVTAGYFGKRGLNFLRGKAIARAVSVATRGVAVQRVESFTLNIGKKFIAGGEQVTRAASRQTFIAGSTKVSTAGETLFKGTATVVTTGRVTPRILGVPLRTREFIVVQSSKVGGAGNGIYRGSVGRLGFFEQYGLTATGKVTSTYAVVNKPFTRLGNLRNVFKANKQLTKNVQVSEKNLEFTIPPFAKDFYIRYSKTLGGTLSPREAGVVLNIPKAVKTIGFKGRGSQSSTSFFKSLYQTTVQVPKVLSKPFTTSISKVSSEFTKVTPEIKTISGLPVGGSLYAGNGLYKQTGFTSVRTNLINPSMSSVQIKQTSFVLPKVSIAVIPALRERTQGRTTQIPRVTELTVLDTRQETRQIPRTTTIQQQRLFLRQSQFLRQTFKFPRATTIKTSIRIKPPKIIPFKFSKLRGKKDDDKSLFPVLVRRKGQFQTIGYGRTIGEAVNIGREVTGKTLARSFTIGGVSPSKVFGFKTKQEKAGTVFIQPAKTSLSSKGEKIEIKMFRQLKGGRR